MAAISKLSPIKMAAFAFLAFTLRLNAQLSVDGHPVQVHGFVSQGFAYSDVNNYLTIPTSRGSFALTDAGLNVSTQLTDKFRFGAQAYVRKVGEMGKGHVTLDWASGDYRFKDWLGIRAGKVKTVWGLYNDTQDAEFLQTWALLPQSIYPIDLREASIAHLGADLYGSIPVHNFGRLDYTVFGGKVLNDTSGGYAVALDAARVHARSITGWARGTDLRWTLPIPGLLAGASFLATAYDVEGVKQGFGNPVSLVGPPAQKTALYAQYSHGNLRLDAEYARELLKVDSYGVYGPYGPHHAQTEYDRRSWYVSAAYRLSKHLEVGTYNSRFFPDADRRHEGPALLPASARHVFDQVFTARIDLTRFWDLKIEGHLIDGYGDFYSFRGFYPQDNPTGYKPRTNLLVVRMGANF